MSLDAEVLMKADEIYGTKTATPHQLLLDTRFELPFGEGPPTLSTLNGRVSQGRWSTSVKALGSIPNKGNKA